MKRTITGKTYSKVIGVKKGELAVFDDNGELKSSGKKPSDIHDSELPSYTQEDDGKVLTATAAGPAWVDIPKELPSGGTQGQFLVMGANGPEWVTVG